VKYLCLGYFDKKAMDARPKSEIDAYMRQCKAPLAELYGSKELVFDAGLGEETVSVRIVKGKQMVTDGPFVETREVVGSAFLVEARDMDEAVRVASLHPAARLGEEFGWGIQIRPVGIFHEG
jgi:hypothetical protein